jgi:hypothetical protein
MRSALPGAPTCSRFKHALQVVVRLDIHDPGRIDDIGGLCALCEIGGIGDIAPSCGERLLHRRSVSHIKSKSPFQNFIRGYRAFGA